MFYTDYPYPFPYNILYMYDVFQTPVVKQRRKNAIKCTFKVKQVDHDFTELLNWVQATTILRYLYWWQSLCPHLVQIKKDRYCRDSHCGQVLSRLSKQFCFFYDYKSFFLYIWPRCLEFVHTWFIFNLNTMTTFHRKVVNNLNSGTVTRFFYEITSWKRCWLTQSRFKHWYCHDTHCKFQQGCVTSRFWTHITRIWNLP